MREDIVIIGGGLAGSEAAWQAANRGAKVTLYEMRPKEQTAAHKTGYLAELVCSNSLGSGELQSAPGLLKEEMRRLGSLIIKVANDVRVPAGAALAVDRDLFAQKITQALEGHPNIRILREPVSEVPPDCLAIVATGPLTSDSLAAHLKRLTNATHLYFYDAISPIVDADSIDMSKVFKASRYNKGAADYLNCPMTEAEYDAFHQALLAAEKVVPKEFEKIPYFEGCIPIEVMAERGRDTMMFGPMKPVGLVDPRTNTRPYAVVQLRMENRHGTCYNLVGFQTKLTYGAQKRVFRMIPGLENAEFLRYGSVHRNTFVNAPTLLRDTLQLKSAGRHQRRPRPAGPKARGPAGDDLARRAAQVHHDQRLAALSADEHQLRPLSASPHPHPRQAGAATPGRTARLGGLCRMDAAVRSFLTYLQVERGASPHTLRNYEGDLRQFLAFLQTAHKGSLPAPTVVDAYVVRGFLAARAGLGDAKSSLGRKLAAIRSLFKYLAREEVVPHSPAAAVVTPKQEHKLPRVLTADDAKRLMDDPGSNEPRSLRDQALLEVLYSAGVRVAELVGLNVEDVDLDTGTATALGKGRKERVVLLGTKAVEALRAYL